jgi:hypothetical protein
MSVMGLGAWGHVRAKESLEILWWIGVTLAFPNNAEEIFEQFGSLLVFESVT